MAERWRVREETEGSGVGEKKGQREREEEGGRLRLLQRYFCEWWIMGAFPSQVLGTVKYFQLGVERQNWYAGRNTAVSFLNIGAERKNPLLEENRQGGPGD